MGLAQLTERREMHDPGLIRMVFASTAMAPVWLVVRLYVGWQWLSAGWHKLDGEGWITDDGASLLGFWERIVQIPEKGRPAIQYDWYRDFIQFMLDREWYEWFAQVIAYGEFAIGIALIVGAFSGIAAFSGAFMNFNFMLAGSASTNPVLFLLAILLLLGWKVAGYIGVDRWLLPLLGTPWQPLPVRRSARR